MKIKRIITSFCAVCMLAGTTLLLAAQSQNNQKKRDSKKTLIPFCSNGGRLGQSVSAITKLVPDAKVQSPLSVYYSGGATLDSDLDKWLAKNRF